MSVYLYYVKQKVERALKSTKAAGLIQTTFIFCPSEEVLRFTVASLHSGRTKE